MNRFVRSKLTMALRIVAFMPAIAAMVLQGFQPTVTQAAALTFPARGSLDCNGYSKIQQPIKAHDICADFAGYDGSRGYDNGHYIGHDEPTVNFFSNSPGSASNMQWKVTLPTEHALPATQSFENYIAFWFGLDLCDPNSYPQNPCIPDSDKNPPVRFANDPLGAGSAFLEMQFYPPGFAPFISQISCDQTHWCASLHINSLECTAGFTFCNPNCQEPTNFAFIQMDGVPTGPPGPVDATNASFTPNDQTLLMNQGDTLKVTIKDTPDGLLNRIDDLTTGQSGYMVASAANGFQSLNVNTCAPTNFSFRPEFSTSKFGNFLSWGPGQSNVGWDFEVGHFTPGANGDNDADDAPCFSGPTLPGCLDFATGGDLDFDGTSYLPVWPDGTNNTASPILLSSVLGNGIGPVSSTDGSSGYRHPYSSFQFDTEVLDFEPGCQPSGAGCTVPPAGAAFYPYFNQLSKGKSCLLTFGMDVNGATVNDFGRDAEWGRSNPSWDFHDSSSGILPNPCTPHHG
jgi:hypothetical protein